MPQNEQGEVYCINHQKEILQVNPKIAVTHTEDRPDAGNQIPANFKFDVYICPICLYTEFYTRRNSNPTDGDIVGVQVKAEW